VEYAAAAVDPDEGDVELVTESFPIDGEVEPEPEPGPVPEPEPEPEPVRETTDGDYFMSYEVKKKSRKMKMTKECGRPVEAPIGEASTEPQPYEVPEPPADSFGDSLKSKEVKKGKKSKKKHRVSQPLEEPVAQEPLPEVSFVEDGPAEEAVPELQAEELAEEPQPEVAYPPECEPEPEPVVEYGTWGSSTTTTKKKKKKTRSIWHDEPMPEASADVETAPEAEAEAEKAYDPWSFAR
jgi:hypothetical protein